MDWVGLDHIHSPMTVDTVRVAVIIASAGAGDMIFKIQRGRERAIYVCIYREGKRKIQNERSPHLVPWAWWTVSSLPTVRLWPNSRYAPCLESQANISPV